jgi:GNAT superfamily N-acetyltransferase
MVVGSSRTCRRAFRSILKKYDLCDMFNIFRRVHQRSAGMEIIDIAEKHEPLYFLCLEDWSDELKEAGNHKELWYNAVKDKGLGVKLAVDDRGEVGGMIQYMPIERTHVPGKDLHFVHCIWVHGHKKGRGNFQKKGMGKALRKAAEEDARSKGAKGMAAWGVSLPFWSGSLSRMTLFPRNG